MTDWDRVVTDHGPMILRLACRILGDGPDADDVAQEAFVEAYRVEQNQPVGNWGGLLRRVVVHRALDRLRYRRRRADEPLDESEPSRGNDNPQQTAVLRERAERLREAIGELPRLQGSVVCLRYFEALSYNEIAESLDIEVGTIGGTLHKARAKLKAILAVSMQGE